jgi:flagellar biogenesis protein FliO
MGAAIRHPDIKSLSVLMILIVLFMIVSIWLSRKIGNPAKARS